MSEFYIQKVAYVTDELTVAYKYRIYRVGHIMNTEDIHIDTFTTYTEAIKGLKAYKEAFDYNEGNTECLGSYQ